MNKSELIKTLAEQSNLSLDESTMVVNTFVDSMKKALLEGDRVEIRGFGSFKIKEYESYAGRNPRTGARVEVQPAGVCSCVWFPCVCPCSFIKNSFVV